jgi:hypothetical protein
MQLILNGEARPIMFFLASAADRVAGDRPLTLHA